MKYYSTRTVDPTIDAVPLDTFKEHVRQKGSQRDEDVLRKLRAAIRWVEDYTGRALMGQTWELAIDDEGAWDPGAYIALPRPPLLSTTLGSFKYWTSAEVETTYAATNYWVDAPGHRVVLKTGYVWPEDTRATRSIAIVYTAGYSATDHEKIPASIRDAICRVGAHFLTHPEAMLTGTISKEIELGIRDQLYAFNENLGL